MLLRRLLGYSRRQFIIHRFHLGGMYEIKSYLQRYIFGLRNNKIIYRLLYQYFFVKKVLFLLSNSLRTYYDKVLFINSHYGYVFIFKRLCQILDMPYLYTKWVHGVLSNIIYFYKNVSRVKRNHLEGLYNMAFVPALTLNLNGLYNLSSLKEGRELTSVICGILDYDIRGSEYKEMSFDRNAYLNYFFLGNDDNIKSLNFIMFLVIVAIFYRKLFLYSIFKGYKRGNVAMYYKKDVLPTSVLFNLQGCFVYFYKNFGSSKFLKSFYWYRHLRDYYFFPFMAPGDYERLSQQFLSVYKIHKKKHKILFFKTWQRRHKNYYFFNLRDNDFLQQVQMLFWSFFIKKFNKVYFFGKKNKIRSSNYRDKYTLLYFFLYEKFYYQNLIDFYTGFVYNLNLNIKFISQFKYFNFIHSFNNINNYKIINYFKGIIGSLFINRKPMSLCLNFFSKLNFLYHLVYNSDVVSKFMFLSVLKKRVIYYERKYFWTKVNEGKNFKVYNKGARFFSNMFSKALKKRRFCSMVSRHVKSLSHLPIKTDFLYYYHHYINPIIPFWRTFYFKVFKRLEFFKFYSLFLHNYKRFRKSNLFFFFFYKPIVSMGYDSFLLKNTHLV